MLNIRDFLKMIYLYLLTYILKVSKSQKEILDSHTPKNQRNVLHFSALASKSGQIKRTRALYYVYSPNQCIMCFIFFYLTTF